jgi:hypothetical protein
MCFSAEASFTASAVLTGAGVIAVRKAHTLDRLPLALIPVFFAVQQFAEGVLWLVKTGRAPSGWEHPAAYLFLAFAFSFWPLYMPFAFYALEPKRRRRRWMYPLLLLGGVVALYSGRHIFTSGGEACVEQWHIDYCRVQLTGQTSMVGTLFYVVAVTLPSVSSSQRGAPLFGLGLGGTLLLALWIQARTFVSVWCFFAAWISLEVLWLLARMQPAREPVPVGLGGWLKARP